MINNSLVAAEDKLLSLYLELLLTVKFFKRISRGDNVFKYSIDSITIFTKFPDDRLMSTLLYIFVIVAACNKLSTYVFISLTLTFLGTRIDTLNDILKLIRSEKSRQLYLKIVLYTSFQQTSRYMISFFFFF